MVLRGGEHAPAVRAKDCAKNGVDVALKKFQDLAAVDLPESRGTVCEAVITRRLSGLNAALLTVPVWPWKRMMEPIERKAVPRAISGNRVDLFVSEDDGVFPVDLPDPLPQVSDQLIESLILSLGGKIPIEIADQADTDRNVIQVIAVDVATGGAGAPNDCRFQSVRYRRTCHCR